jgi:type I restriction-modification system DNA methylase subunit
MDEPSGQSLEQAYEAVKKLVEDFKAHERDYLSPNYQESHVRQDFIDKFFIALGWDVTHERQKNPHEYEVQIENRVQIGSTQQRADYAFFLAPNFRDPKFFVEAKKPARELENPDFFYQTMRYGWNGNTPIAILTDFEEFYVIDCRLKPTIKEALSRRIQSFHYTDYADKEKFVWIYYLFSREAVAGNSIEKFAAKLESPKGGKVVRGVSKSQPVDDVFLAELDGYRESLAKGFKKSNQELDGEELTEAVQRTIDRLVFIRFLEDKLIEEKEIANLIDRQMAWELFVGYCRKLEPKYNGLIFKPHPVIDSEKFKPPDEEVFREICEGLAGRESPYNFAQIPISILGSIYERFLGKVVHATDKRVKVEEKPEVRKAGGVYYTPDYIVRYIVKETVGKLIEGKTPDEISKMAFADIACGSGSFLIEVYDLLLKYHERYYTEHPEKAKKGDTEQREGRKVLSLKKRQEILVNNIYGVDIDYQATEVTQLSLYLKLLEDVTTNDAYQFSLLKEKILPNLSNNIVCGNSLIGRDIVEGNLFPDVDESKLKPMNFEDAFPEVMHHGGFDAVVGNPPYRMIQPHNTEEVIIEYMKQHYVAAEFKIDLFHLFLQKAMTLIREKGNAGYIVPSSILNNVYAEDLRKWLMSYSSIVSIAVAKEKVFANAEVHTCVMIFSKDSKADERLVNRIQTTGDLSEDFASTPVFSSYSRQADFLSLPGTVWNISVNESNAALIRRLISQSKELNATAKINRGLITGDRSKYFAKKKETKKHIAIIAGTDVQRYFVKPPGEFVLFERPETAGGCWDEEVHLAPHKVVVRQIGAGPTAGILLRPIAVTGNIFTVMSENLQYEMFLLGVINSKLADFYWRVMFNDFKSSFPQVTIFSLSQLPIRVLDLTVDKDKTRHDHIVNLVERMLAAKEELGKAKTEAETTRLERECESLDRQIDQAVYELYGLTEEEIRVVENV